MHVTDRQASHAEEPVRLTSKDTRPDHIEHTQERRERKTILTSDLIGFQLEGADAGMDVTAHAVPCRPTSDPPPYRLMDGLERLYSQDDEDWDKTGEGDKLS